jgi:negative regulator of sigma E activity
MTDKFDTHYSQQLSALMDGDLPPDQARFLLRRLEHDTELTGRWERWQLCGDVLRGQAQAPAPTGFAGQIAAAIAAESARSSANIGTGRGRSLLVRWGGGALAASVAVIALFMARQQVPDEAPAPAAPTVAGQSPGANPVVSPATPAAQTSSAQAAAAVTAASVAVASVPRRDRPCGHNSPSRSNPRAGPSPSGPDAGTRRRT